MGLEPMSGISWRDRLPLPWRRWRVVLQVRAVDGIPETLPGKGAVLVGSRPDWLVFDCPCERGHRVTLSLDPRREPSWAVETRRPLTLDRSFNDFTIDHMCHYTIRLRDREFVRKQWIRSGAWRPQDQSSRAQEFSNPSGVFVGSGLYLRSVASGTDTQYVDARNLVWTGQCTSLNLTRDVPDSGSGELGAWTMGYA